jgi:rubrerythrin
MDELEILTQAMKLEKEGREFYLMAADRTRDRETEKIFTELADDETLHYKYVEGQYLALSEAQGWLEFPELTSVESIDAGAPVFPAGLKEVKDLPAEPSDEEALLFALGAETRSYELYSRGAKATDDPHAKRMFESLAAAERAHFDTLMMRFESRFDYPR